MKHHFNGIHIVSKNLTALFSAGQGLAVTIFPFVFYKNKYIKWKQTIQLHEKIHLQQQLECGLAGVLIFISGVVCFDQVLLFLPAVFFYYILYFLLFFINLFRHEDRYKAYENIAFEREAYKHENQTDYLVFRKPFAWLKEL